MKKIKILVSHQKGGVGKSTIATNLAGYFAEILKLKTCLIDFDSQNSASNWIDTINKPELLDVSRFSNIARSGNSLNYPAIRMHLRNKARDYEVIIADMTWSNHLNCQIIPDFDLLLVPTSLSAIHDSFTHFCKMILAAMEFKISKHNVIKDTKPVASLISHIESKSTAPVDTLKINSIIPQFLRR